MSSSQGLERTKICPRCGRTFACYAGGCWCGSVTLSQATLDELRQSHDDCLCQDCLTAHAEPSASGSNKTRILMSWSSGKDSAMALHELLQSDKFEVVALLTTISEEYKRISHHGVREALLDAQASAIGLPLEKIYLPSNESRPCTNEVYEEIMDRALRKYQAQGVTAVGFGDLYLEDLRAWREKNLAKLGLSGIFPLWKRDTSALADEMIACGFKAYLSCVEGKVGPGFVGRSFDKALLRDLPPGIDPCGENGEFHSFVYDGPIFKQPVDVRVGQTVIRDGRFYADLLPDGPGEADVRVSDESIAAGIPPVV